MNRPNRKYRAYLVVWEYPEPTTKNYTPVVGRNEHYDFIRVFRTKQSAEEYIKTEVGADLYTVVPVLLEYNPQTPISLKGTKKILQARY